MSEIVERVETAISEACNYALPPFLLEKAAYAAIEAMREHFVKTAEACQFSEDKHAMFCAVDELDEALSKVTA